MKTKGQTVAVHWNTQVSFACPIHCKTKQKALIVYDDATCAATTSAILHRAADRADIFVKWDIRPWREDKRAASHKAARRDIGYI
jgi:hypothetical protein